MIECLLKLKVPLIAVLDSDENRSLLLKDHQWALASEVVCVLQPFERATVVLSGQEYPTLSLVLPVISGLCKALNEPPAAAASNTIKSFRQHLSRELRQKFEALPTSTSSLAAAVDPRFRSLSFLKDDDARLELKTEILQRIKAYAAESSQGCQDASEPPPLKKSKSALDELLGEADMTQHCSDSLLEEELQLYFTERPVPTDRDPLLWWKTNQERFPHIAELAISLLCIPGTSVPAEQVFSCSGLIVDKLRCSLSPENVNMLVFLSKNKLLPAARSGLQAAMPQVPQQQPQQQPEPQAIDFITVLEEEVGDPPFSTCDS